MYKKIISACMIACICLCMFSCSSKKEKNFKTQAEECFKQYTSELKSKTETEYSDTGSVAIMRPAKLSEDMDAKLSKLYDKLKADFKSKSPDGNDMLIMTYKACAPKSEIYSIEVFAKEILKGETTETSHVINAVTPDEKLMDMAKISAKLQISSEHGDIDYKTLKEAEATGYKFTDTALNVTLDVGEKISADVPYTTLYAVLPELIKNDTAEPTRYIDPEKKMVALTFDDGPHKTNTARITDILEKHNGVATFFEVGNLVNNAPEQMKHALEIGCEIGSHTWSHANLRNSSVERIKDEISKSDTALKEIIGYTPSLLRPPYGAQNATLRETTDKYLIGWSVDTLDWKSKNTSAVVSAVKSEGNLDGDVILMHSLYDTTVGAVNILVPWLEENGYQLVTVTELIGYKYKDIPRSGVYYADAYFNNKAK